MIIDSGSKDENDLDEEDENNLDIFEDADVAEASLEDDG